MKYILYLIIVLFPIRSIAQEVEDIVTDRPDETESATLITKGYLQVETGFFYEELKENSFLEKTWAYNTSLLRYGLLENLELRLGLDVIDKVEISDDFLMEPGTGLSPLLLGVKVGITEEKGVLPKMALLGHLYLPFTAKKAYRPESTGVDFRFAFNHEFTNSNLSYNLGAKWWDDAPHATYIYTMAYGYDLTEKLGVLVELYGDLPEKDGPSHHWDGGFTYLVTKNFQLDAFIGSGLNNEQHIIYGGGISIRIPN